MTEYSYIYSGTDVCELPTPLLILIRDFPFVQSGSCKYTATKTVLNITAYGYASCDWSGCPGPYLSESKMREYLVIAPITVNIYSSWFVLFCSYNLMEYWWAKFHEYETKLQSFRYEKKEKKRLFTKKS